jgi:hypothetical protein
MLIAASCDDGNGDGNTPSCTAPSGGAIELTYPEGGESLAVGSTKTVTFKIDKNTVDGVVLAVSLDGGITFTDIVSSAIMASGDAQYQCLTYSWTIGSEANTVNYATGSNSVIMKVSFYADPTIAVSSGAFTVTK